MGFPKLPRPVHICNCSDHAWSALTHGYVTLVSIEDAHLLEDRAWSAKISRRTVYARASKSASLHRKIMGAADEEKIDHKNGIGLDNRRPNLRPSTNQQNCQNGSSHRDSTSKYKGVSWDKKYKLWRASIFFEGKQICIGRYRDEILAAVKYDESAIKYFGEYARPNFPELQSSAATSLPDSCLSTDTTGTDTPAYTPSDIRA